MMLKLYLKQAWTLLRQNPLFSGLYIDANRLPTPLVFMPIHAVDVKGSIPSDARILVRPPTPASWCA